MANEKQSVIVIGGGIFGLTTAWFCAKHGLSVTLLERTEIGSGASGGLMGAMSPHVPERWNEKKQFQLDALLSARTFWSEVEAISGIPVGYARNGRLIPLPDVRSRELALERQDYHATVWKTEAEWRVSDPGEITAHLSPEICAEGVVTETLSARIQPARACRSLAAALRQSGVVIHENWPVEEVASGQVTGPRGTLRTDRTVIAAGVESFDFYKQIVGDSIGTGVKGQSALLSGGLPASAPQIFADGVYIIPHADGTVAVGSTSEPYWDHPSETDLKLDRVLEKASTICPSLRSATVLQRWAGIRPRGRKPDPILGSIPGQPDLFVATGGFKIGFGIAHKCGEVVADLIADQPTDAPTSYLTGWQQGVVS